MFVFVVFMLEFAFLRCACCDLSLVFGGVVVDVCVMCVVVCIVVVQVFGVGFVFVVVVLWCCVCVSVLFVLCWCVALVCWLLWSGVMCVVARVLLC